MTREETLALLQVLREIRNAIIMLAETINKVAPNPLDVRDDKY